MLIHPDSTFHLRAPSHIYGFYAVGGVVRLHGYYVIVFGSVVLDQFFVVATNIILLAIDERIAPIDIRHNAINVCICPWIGSVEFPHSTEHNF